MGYRPDIDALRAVAVLAVLFHHVWPHALGGGYIGVDVFFVISGYLITKIVSAEIGKGTFSFLEFYERRARRLLPALLVVLAAIIVAGWVFLLPSDYLSTLKASVATTVFSSNILFWRELSEGYFAPDAKLNPLLHTWSLGVEEQFYLLYPVLLVFLVRRAPTWLKPLLLAGAAVSLGLSAMFVSTKSVAVFFLTPFRAWELAVGALLALGVVPAIQAEWARTTIRASGLIAIVLSASLYKVSTTFPGFSAILPVLGAAAVIHTATVGKSGFLDRVLIQPWLVYVGTISYSLYLWHWPIVVFAKYVLQVEVGFWLGCAMVLASILISAASYRFVELPFRMPSVKRRRRVLGWGLGASAAFAAVAAFGVMAGGFQGRVNEQARIFDTERNPEIPFKPCDRKVGGCLIGAPGATPTIAFWGDSHMLAWAPAIERELKARGLSAQLMVHSACPPVWGVESVRVETCQPTNERVRRFLESEPGIKRVVIAAHWQMYLKPGRIRATNAESDDKDREKVLSDAVAATVNALLNGGRGVSVIGSVPTYNGNVPFELARGLRGLGSANGLSVSENIFGPELRRVAEANGAHYVDVMSRLCKPDCELVAEGHSVYRDDQHLSVLGALRHSDVVAEAIGEPQGAIGLGASVGKVK